jgi:hypothetical protein
VSTLRPSPTGGSLGNGPEYSLVVLLLRYFTAARRSRVVARACHKAKSLT